MTSAVRRSAILLAAGAILGPASLFGTSVAGAQPTLYALPACYGGATQPTERPDQAQFQTCADGSKELTGITWTRFGPDGAEGTGMYSYNVCEPNCAAGHRDSFPVVVHADEPQPLAPDSACPPGTMFFGNLVIAYPDGVPNAEGGAPNMRFRGMPATLYSTAAAPDAPTSLASPRC